jgi:hypothetical protein
MLTCMMDTLEDQVVAVIKFPNEFVQTVVKDEENCVVICIRGPLVDNMVCIAADVYGPYVSTNKAG